LLNFLFSVLKTKTLTNKPKHKTLIRHKHKKQKTPFKTHWQTSSGKRIDDVLISYTWCRIITPVESRRRRLGWIWSHLFFFFKLLYCLDITMLLARFPLEHKSSSLTPSCHAFSIWIPRKANRKLLPPVTKKFIISQY
jgi:hypothetical protein